MADKDDALALLGPRICILAGEDDLAGCGTGGGLHALGDRRGLGLGVELRVQDLIKLRRVHHHDRFFLADPAFLDHVRGDLDGGLRGALTVACLQHPQLALLDGELDILHVVVVGLEVLADVGELLVDRGHLALELADRQRGADAGHDVLALCVEEELAVDLLLAAGGVAGECDAGA